MMNVRILILVMSSILMFSCSTKTQETPLTLRKISHIVSLSKIDIQPISWIENQMLRFRLSINSTQNPNLLSQDMSQIIILDIGEGAPPLSPVSWEVINQTNYSIEGDVVFSIEQLPKQLKFSIFVPDEVDYTWQLKTE